MKLTAKEVSALTVLARYHSIKGEQRARVFRLLGPDAKKVAEAILGTPSDDPIVQQKADKFNSWAAQLPLSTNMKTKAMKDFEKIVDLQERYKNGERFEFIFFWRGPFSQWVKPGFTVDGVFYKTAEHWMMAEKARLFNDEETLQKIIEADHPSIAKDLGRQVKNYKEDLWAQHRYNIVLSGNRYKFTQNNESKAILLETGSKILVEASPVDRIWGIGLAEDNEVIHNPCNWQGLNLLGFALTDLRDELKHV